MKNFSLLPSSQGFLGLPTEESVSYEQAKVVIIPFGLEKSVSYGAGTALGPKAMIEASHQVELFDEQLWCEPYKEIGMVTLDYPVIANNLPDALEQLEQKVTAVLADHKFPFVLGGEHAITAGAIRPFAQRYDDLVILHFDAHADLRDGYEGEHYSHASALRRCLDYPHIKLISCGIRNISAEEIPFLERQKNRIDIFWAKDKNHWDLEYMLDIIRGKPVYITFDLDAFDASLMPATGTPEPGGLFWQETIDILYQCSKNCTLVGADINELAPIPQLHSCNFLAAKLAYKMISYAYSKQLMRKQG